MADYPAFPPNQIIRDDEIRALVDRRDSMTRNSATAIVLLVLAVLALLSLVKPEPMPVQGEAPQRYAIVRAGLEIARYDAKENTLTVDPQARRDLLICIKGRCDLAEGWIGK